MTIWHNIWEALLDCKVQSCGTDNKPLVDIILQRQLAAKGFCKISDTSHVFVHTCYQKWWINMNVLTRVYLKMTSKWDGIATFHVTSWRSLWWNRSEVWTRDRCLSSQSKPLLFSLRQCELGLMLRLKAPRLYEASTQLSCAVTPITGCRAFEISLSVHAEVFDDWSRDRTSDVTLTVPALFTHYRSVQTTISVYSIHC